MSQAAHLSVLSPASRATDLCTYCPKMCRHSCPVSNAEPRETFIPQQKMQTLGFLRAGVLPWDEVNAASLYACTGCGHCRTYCAHDNDVASSLLAGRAEAVAHGVGHPALRDATARFASRGPELARALREAIPSHFVSSEAKVGYFPGCETLGLPGAAAALLLVLERIGIEHVRVPLVANPCGGEPLAAAGARAELDRHDELLARELAGCDLLLVGCAPCALRLRDRSRRGQLRAEILHPIEYLAPHTERLRIGRRIPPVYYQDSCHLARGLGVCDPPRRLLARASEGVREFVWTRRDTFCCGGTGGLRETMPEVALAMAESRLAEVRRAGMDTLVTACTTCQRTLSDAAEKVGGALRVVGLAEVLEEATRT